MKQGQPLILLNSNTGNPVYRMLVQTSEELPAYDMGFNKIKYQEEGIKKAMNGLLGEYIYDKSQSNHGKSRNETIQEKKFAQVINTNYCPHYGGYVDFEVFDHDYIPLMEQALNSRSSGLPVKEGPSTEMIPHAGEKYGDNNFLVTDWDYNGIVWDKNPRDVNTGLCSVVNNSISKILEDDNLTDEIVKINKEEYDELVKAKSDYDELKPKYEEGEQEYLKGKKLYEDLQVEEADLRKQLVPIWTKQGEEKTAMVNSLLETVPEAEKEAKREVFESMDVNQLGVIVNSMPPSEGSRGISDGSGKPRGRPSKTFNFNTYKEICESRGLKP